MESMSILWTEVFSVLPWENLGELLSLQMMWSSNFDKGM